MEMVCSTAVTTVLLLLLSSSRADQNTSSSGDQLPLNCSNADLECLLQGATSDSILSLTAGSHQLLVPIVIQDLNNIVISGPQPTGTTIICHRDAGLTFAQVSNLTLERISFEGCGMTGERVRELSNMSTSVDNPVQVPDHSRIGVVISMSTDVKLHNVTIRNSPGLGLLGINVVGQFSIQQSHFISNKNSYCLKKQDSFCNTNNESKVGGGVFLVYHDTFDISSNASVLVDISDSVFTNNHGCTNNGKLSAFGRNSNIASVGYSIGDGGLGIALAQQHFPLSIFAMNCNFTNNIGSSGSAIQLLIFSGVKDSSISIENCFMDSNGYEENTLTSAKRTKGGAIGLILGAPPLGVPFKMATVETNIFNTNVSILIKESNLVGNKAFFGGGVHIHSFVPSKQTPDSPYKVTVIVSKCMLVENEAILGPGLFGYDEGASNGINSAVLLKLVNTSIIRSILNLQLFVQIMTLTGAVDLTEMGIVFAGECAIVSNPGCGVQLLKSTITNEGDLRIEDNSGLIGGGLRLLDHSLIILRDNSTLRLLSNKATLIGGAIFTNFAGLSTLLDGDCFLHLTEYEILQCEGERTNLNDTGIVIEMLNNSAPVGSLVYGSVLSSCLWAQELINMQPSDPNVYKLLQKHYPTVFITDEDFNTDNLEDIVSTPGVKIVLENDSNSLSAVPGQTLQLKIDILDKLNSSLPGVIVAPFTIVDKLSTTPNTTFSGADVGDSGYWFIHDDSSSLVPITMLGRERETLEIILTTEDKQAALNFTISLQDCRPGFNFESSSSSCVCGDQLLANENVECDVSTQAIVVREGYWVGPLDESLPNTSNTIDNYIVHECIFDYCGLEEKRKIFDGDFDVQCNPGYNRTGLLCGVCEANHSIIMGSNKCLMCTHWYIPLFYFIVVLNTIFSIVVYAYLEVTIAYGFINGILFYCSILDLYSSSIIPHLNSISILFPLTFINNYITGFEVCVYDGMSALARQYLLLINPLCVFMLMITLFLFAKYCKRFNRASGSIVKALATLLIVLYLSILRVSAQVLTPVVITTISGDHHLRWRYDPTVVYFLGWHGLLSLIAITLIIIYIIPLPLFLMFPSRLYKTKRMSYLKPVYDAFWNPLKPNFRNWLAIRLLMRVIPFLTISLSPAGSSSLRIFISLLALFLFFLVQITVYPFQGKWQNLFDNFFVGNMIVVLMGALYFKTNGDSAENDYYLTVYSTIIISLAYVAMIIILIIHIFIKWPNLKTPFLKLGKRVQERLHKFTLKKKATSTPPTDLNASEQEIVFVRSSPANTKTASTTVSTGTDLADSGQIFITTTDNQITTKDNTLKHQIVSFTELREPLLDIGEAEIVTTYTRELTSNLTRVSENHKN